MEVSLAVLAATLTTSIVFFPVTFLSGVSKYIFTPLALGVVLSIFASYFFAMTVVPLFCATFMRVHHETGGPHGGRISFFQRIDRCASTCTSNACWNGTKRLPSECWCGRVYRGCVILGVRRADDPGAVSVSGPRLLSAHRSGTIRHQRAHAERDAARGQQRYIARVEKIIRDMVQPSDLGMIVSNIGVYPDLSAIYTTNASMDTAFVQTSLKEDHSVGSYEYMARVRRGCRARCPNSRPTSRLGVWWIR